jgi:hypothetical protein
MAPTILLLKRMLSMGGLFFLVGCVHGGEGATGVPPATNTPHQMTSSEFSKLVGSNDTLRAAFDHAAKQREDRRRGVPLPPSAFPLPNPDAGPHRPPPSAGFLVCRIAGF